MTDPDSSLVHRLRANERENRRAFEQAGLPVPDMPAVRCPGCDSTEGALFWKPVKRAGGRVRLACPVCQETVVTYHVSRNQVHTGLVSPNGVGFLSGVAGVFAVAGTLLFLVGTEPGRAVAEDARVALARWAGSQSVGRETPPSGAAGLLERWVAPGAERSSSRVATDAAAVLAAPGDRRAEVEEARLPPALVEEVRYDSTLDRTVVVLAPGAEGWVEELRARGWTGSEQ
jgi:hypothetical protein